MRPNPGRCAPALAAVLLTLAVQARGEASGAPGIDCPSGKPKPKRKLLLLSARGGSAFGGESSPGLYVVCLRSKKSL